MRGWLVGAIIGLIVSIIGYVAFIFYTGEDFGNVSGPAMWLFTLLPIFFGVGIGAFIGSWAQFFKDKSNNKVQIN